MMKTNLESLCSFVVFYILGCFVSWKTFMLNKTQKTKKDTLRGFPVNIPYFDLNNEIVWGATSMILSEFKAVLKDIL